MHSKLNEVPVAVEIPGATVRSVDWGSMTVETGRFGETMDVAPLFAGLPEDRCQCPHWGYVIKGRLRFRFAGREEVYTAGEAYYADPGHTPVIEAGTEYVEFSPSTELAKTMAVVERNIAAVTS
jgi:hypothetical protein